MSTLPGGLRVGDRVYYRKGRQDFKSGDQLQYGMVGEVTGAADSNKDVKVRVKFVDCKRRADIFTENLSKTTPPPLAGGYTTNDKVYFISASKKCKSGTVEYGASGEITGPADDDDGSEIEVQFDSLMGKIDIALCDLGRSPPPTTLAGGFKVGEQVYSKTQHSYKSGDVIYYGMRGEIIGPGGSGKLALRFPGHKGGKIDIALCDLGRSPPPTTLAGGFKVGEQVYSKTHQSFTSGDVISHGMRGEIIGPVSGESGKLTLRFPGQMALKHLGIDELSRTPVLSRVLSDLKALPVVEPTVIEGAVVSASDINVEGGGREGGGAEGGSGGLTAVPVDAPPLTRKSSSFRRIYAIAANTEAKNQGACCTGLLMATSTAVALGMTLTLASTLQPVPCSLLSTGPPVQVGDGLSFSNPGGCIRGGRYPSAWAMPVTVWIPTLEVQAEGNVYETCEVDFFPKWNASGHAGEGYHTCLYQAAASGSTGTVRIIPDSRLERGEEPPASQVPVMAWVALAWLVVIQFPLLARAYYLACVLDKERAADVRKLAGLTACGLDCQRAPVTEECHSTLLGIGHMGFGEGAAYFASLVLTVWMWLVYRGLECGCLLPLVLNCHTLRC